MEKIAMHPQSLRNDRESGLLEVLWHDGLRQQFGAPFLRAQCRCADCKAERLRSAQPPAISPTMQIIEIRPVGAYGMQLIFSDGHERGIYPWVYLHGLIDGMMLAKPALPESRSLGINRAPAADDAPAGAATFQSINSIPNR